MWTQNKFILGYLQPNHDQKDKIKSLNLNLINFILKICWKLPKFKPKEKYENQMTVIYKILT